MSGNSHQRKVARTAAPIPPSFGNTSNSQEATRKGPPERIHRFLEHGSLQTLIGIVGGLVGTFLDGRYFALLGIWVSYSLHRSGALHGFTVRPKVITHLCGVSLAASLLFYVGVAINRARPHVYTPADYKLALEEHRPLPITQQVTNVYQSYVSPPKTAGEPRIDLSEFTFDGSGKNGNLLFHTDAVNNGTEPALDSQGSTDHRIGIFTAATQDALFDELYKASRDKLRPRSDIPPGKQYEKAEFTEVPLSPQDRGSMQNGQSLIVGRLDTYKDAVGHRYATEL